MKKGDTTLPDKARDTLLEGTDLIRAIPGTRPDCADDAALAALHLSPLLETLPQAEPPDGLFEDIEAEIDRQAVAQVKTLRADEGVWEQRNDLIWKKVLAEDPETGRKMYLLRCLPGAVITSHVHKRTEHLFILEGEFWIDDKLYCAGDTQVSLAGKRHGEIKAPGGCLVLVSV